MQSDISQSLLTFAVDIYKQAQLHSTTGDGNVFCSPFSIAAALGMTLAGARGRTAREISSALHVNDPNPLHRHFSTLHKSFRSFVPNIALHIANRIYCEKEFLPVPAYSALLRRLYGTSIESVDFSGDAEAVRLQINAWVDEGTGNKIKDLLPQGSVTVESVLVLINAVYFKGIWHRQFNANLTHTMDFHETSTATSTVNMMYRKGKFKVGHSDEMKATALEIPYKGMKTSMMALLPDESEGLKSMEEALTPQSFLSTLKGLRVESDVEVYLPRLKMEQDMDLKTTLQQLGVQDLFGAAADLSGICPVGQLKVSDAIHKSFAEINEEGTEAAAASAVLEMYCSSPIMDNRIFKADHPFMFFILARDPTTVLFVGSVRRPQQ